jgi:hypothetical protein
VFVIPTWIGVIGVIGVIATVLSPFIALAGTAAPAKGIYEAGAVLASRDFGMSQGDRRPEC